MTEHLLRFLYGAIVISSGFLVGSMGRLAIRELRRVGWHAAVRSVYFWLAANLALSSIALVGICGMRMYDGFHGVALGGSWGWALVIGFGLLLMSKMGFNWAGMIGMQHGKAMWRSLIASLVLWAIFVVAWTWLT